MEAIAKCALQNNDKTIYLNVFGQRQNVHNIMFTKMFYFLVVIISPINLISVCR
jgi:hypothetical protein